MGNILTSQGANGGSGRAIRWLCTGSKQQVSGLWETVSGSVWWWGVWADALHMLLPYTEQHTGILGNILTPRAPPPGTLAEPVRQLRGTCTAAVQSIRGL